MKKKNALERLKRDYYEHKYSLEELGSRFDALGMNNNIHNLTPKELEDRIPHLFYDNNGIPKILVFFKKEDVTEENISSVVKVLKEYYENDSFYFEVGNMRPVDMVRYVLDSRVKEAKVLDLFHDVRKIKDDFILK